jgi:hypothetical protein
MKNPIRYARYAFLAAIFVLGSSISAFTADGMTPAKESKDTGAQPSSKGGMIDVPTPQPDLSSEPGEMASVDVFRGKLLAVQGQRYVLEVAPGRKEDLTVDHSSKIENNVQLQEGDWVEVRMPETRIAKTIKKASPAYTLEGLLVKVDGDNYVVKEASGKEVSLRLGGDTKFQEGTFKIGDPIRANYTPDGKILLIRPAKVPKGVPGAG